jgi:hypothetical protein
MRRFAHGICFLLVGMSQSSSSASSSASSTLRWQPSSDSDEEPELPQPHALIQIQPPMVELEIYAPAPPGPHMRTLARSTARCDLLLSSAIQNFHTSDIDPAVQTMISHTLGDQPRQIMPASVEEKMLEIPARSLPVRIQELASCAYHSVRTFVRNLLTHIITPQRREQWHIQSTFRAIGQDETTMYARGVRWRVETTFVSDSGGVDGSQRSSLPAPPPLALQALPQIPLPLPLQLLPHQAAPLAAVEGNEVAILEHVETEGLTSTKIVRGKLDLQLLLRSVLPRPDHQHDFLLLLVPVILPLRAVDRTTGENLKACVKDWLRIHMFDDVSKSAEATYEAQIADSAASNEKAYASIEADDIPDPDSLGDDVARFYYRARCLAHKISTATGRTYSVVDGLLSGVTATGLALAPSSALVAFRSCVTEVMIASVDVIDAPRPAYDDPAMSRRNAFLDLVLPRNSVASIKRRADLEDFIMTSDLNADRIPLYRPGGASSLDIRLWAKNAVKALIPNQLPVFSKSRWLGSVQIFSECTLLAGVFNLFQRSVPRWRMVLRGKVPRPLTRQSCPEFDVVDSDSDSSVDETAQPGVNWPAWNKKQRRDTNRFASEPQLATSLVIARRFLSPMADLQNAIERIGGRAWHNKQLRLSVESNGALGLTRVQELASGGVTNSFFNQLEELFAKPEMWSMLPIEACRNQHTNLAFACLARSSGGVQQLICSILESMAVQIFRLIREPG